MKFKFKIQQYQTDAVENTVNVFAGQPCYDNTVYRRDLGKRKGQVNAFDQDDDAGFRNHDIELSESELLANIHKSQDVCDIKRSASVVKSGVEACRLDIEMETGTGKTYVYLKTMFELNKRYGWSKFIVVVPSKAIREGVYKSFQTLEDHFMEHYGKKARYFIYNSDHLQQIDSYSSDAGINVMIINAQAFASSFNEEDYKKKVAEGKKIPEANRKIFDRRDEFGSRRPIDVLAANRPIVILDEPQKLEGTVTQKTMQAFRPLFILNYSATHKVQHNLIYALDALDAFRQKLVKKIQVKTLSVKNLAGTSAYMYLDDILLDAKKEPEAKIQLEVKKGSGISREYRRVRGGDKLSVASDNNAYDGFTVAYVHAKESAIEFTNGVWIFKGQVVNDTDLKTIQRLQIRETIEAHFKKEEELFKKGIKCLSLFFIDEVANYKDYDGDEEVHGFLWNTFEEEYNSICSEVLNKKATFFKNEVSDDYLKYLSKIHAEETHSGYFSIDDKGHSVPSKADKKNDGMCDDKYAMRAYDLILKNKEILLSLKNPVRFIFSHSALQEGWDNPNVFQICTLRHATSNVRRRQEVGRGLRLCVNQDGDRQDLEVLGADIHNLNKLTVVANDDYAAFVSGLQSEIKAALRDRPLVADKGYFFGKTIEMDGGEEHTLSDAEATLVYAYLYSNDYIDEKGRVTETYKMHKDAGTLAPMGAKLAGMESALHKMVQATYDAELALDNMVEDGNATEVPASVLNSNYYKQEFQDLWKRLNHKYVYTVDYDSAELVEKAAKSINDNLKSLVSELTYVITEAEQTDVDAFGATKTVRKKASTVSTSTVKYDLVGEIASGANLTRKTVVEILKKTEGVLFLFRSNPESYIKNVVQLIKAEKSTMIVEHIGYSMIDGTYDSDIFTAEKHATLNKSFKVGKHITDYIFTDGYAKKPEESVEVRFAKQLEEAEEVVVYAKLPKAFKIPTPVGSYSPDWAIAFKKGSVKHIFFVAETKGSMDSMQLKAIEAAKIHCAERLFNEISTEDVKYHKVASYEDLLNAMEAV